LGGKPYFKSLALPDIGSRFYVDFFFDFSSPYTYIAATRAARYFGRSLNWCPMLLGAIFKSTGTVNIPATSMCQSRRNYNEMDMQRQVNRSNIQFKFTSHFPLRTVLALRLCLIVGPNTDIGQNLIQNFFRAFWVQDKDPNDENVIINICNDLDLNGKELVEQAKNDENIKQMLFHNNKKAVELGIFGAPIFVVHTNKKRVLYWGNDLLEWAVLESRGLLEKNKL